METQNAGQTGVSDGHFRLFEWTRLVHFVGESKKNLRPLLLAELDGPPVLAASGFHAICPVVDKMCTTCLAAPRLVVKLVRGVNRQPYRAAAGRRRIPLLGSALADSLGPPYALTIYPMHRDQIWSRLKTGRQLCLVR